MYIKQTYTTYFPLPKKTGIRLLIGFSFLSEFNIKWCMPLLDFSTGFNFENCGFFKNAFSKFCTRGNNFTITMNSKIIPFIRRKIKFFFLFNLIIYTVDLISMNVIFLFLSKNSMPKEKKLSAAYGKIL